MSGDAESILLVTPLGTRPCGTEWRTGAVVNTWKGNPAFRISDSLTFPVASGTDAAVEPYALGQYYVLFLDWEPARKEPVQSADYEKSFAFRIEDGRIQSGPLKSYVGKPADELVNELQLLSAH